MPNTSPSTGQEITGQKIAIFGATSEIGGEVARRVARGNTVVLAGRRMDALEQLAAELRSLGAAETIDYRREDFPERIREICGGADIILDVVGAAYLDPNLRALATGGRLVIIGLQKGAKAELNLGMLLGKRARVIGTTLRSRPLEEKRRIMAGVRESVWPLIEDGRIRVTTDLVLPLEDARAAHEHMDSGEHRGKVLLQVRAEDEAAGEARSGDEI